MKAFLLPLAFALLLPACAGAAQPAPDTEGQTATPQRGGVFQTIGIRALEHLHPWTQSTPANATFFLNGGVYDQLVDNAYSPDEDHRFTNKIVPELAEKWDLKDSTLYTFTLRKGVKWHDGQGLTAADVKWSIEYVADPANKILGTPNLKGIESITIPDESTVQIKLKEPEVDFLTKLVSSNRVSILPKHAVDRGDDLERVAIGTGPFKVETFSRDRGVFYGANPDYWRPGMPYVDKFRILPPVDEAGRTAAFFAGQNDVIKAGSRPQAEAVVAQNPQATLSTFFQENNVEMWMRLDRPPFNELRVRQAVQLAVDREAIIGTLTHGDGFMNPPVINGVYRSWALEPSDLQNLPGWRSQKQQDVAQARQLLQEAGRAQGLSFTIKVDRNNPNWPAVAEMISAQLRDVGIDVKLQPMESVVYNKAVADGDYDAYVSGGLQVAQWPSYLHSGGANNYTHLQDPEVDRLVDAQLREFDEGRRAQAIRDIQRILVRNAYTVPTVTYAGYLLLQPWVHGFVDNRGANVTNSDWSQLWLDPARVPANR